MSDITKIDKKELVKLPPEITIQKIEILLSQNVKRETAAAMVGISQRTLYRYQSFPEIRDRFSIAEAKGKGELEEAVNRGATKGFVTKETRTISAPDKQTGRLEIKEIIEIQKENPPDLKAAAFMLRSRFPEEYGSINRVDTKKIGSAKDQVDKDGIPQRPTDPKSTLDMILNGEGVYVVNQDEELNEVKVISTPDGKDSRFYKEYQESENKDFSFSFGDE